MFIERRRFLRFCVKHTLFGNSFNKDEHEGVEAKSDGGIEELDNKIFSSD